MYFYLYNDCVIEERDDGVEGERKESLILLDSTLDPPSYVTISLTIELLSSFMSKIEPLELDGEKDTSSCCP